MNVAVFVLYQRKEFDKAAAFLSRVAVDLSEKIKLYLLINDENCQKIIDFSKSTSSNITVICAGKNLGVAGGRNKLIDLAIAGGAELLISCDTDIIFELGYFSKISKIYGDLRREDKKIGCVQPILINGPDVVHCYKILNDAHSWKDLIGKIKSDENLSKPFWGFIKKTIGEKKALNAVMHTGMTNLWDAHFGSLIDTKFSPKNFVENGLKKKFLSIHHDTALLADVIEKNSPVRISTTAGGVSVFHKDVYVKLGGYNNIFNPFGYEDSEFGFRSVVNGFNNYLIPDCMAIHDIFISGQNRSLMYSARIGLLRGVESGGQDSVLARNSLANQSVFFGFKSLATIFAKSFKNNDMESKKFGSAMLSYYVEFFRGFWEEVRKQNDTDASKLIESFSIPGDKEFKSLKINFDKNIWLVIDKIIKKGCGSSPNKKFSLGIFAYNCRIQELIDDKKLESRYFDLSVNITQSLVENDYDVSLTILSNDICITSKILLSVDLMGAPKSGLIKIKKFLLNAKEHDYGKFSVEELYPSPNLYKSEAWLPSVIKNIDSIKAISPDVGHFKIIDALKQYLLAGDGADRNLIDDYNTHFTESDILFADKKINQKKKILIFTDSRGQHKPNGCSHKLFAEKLMDDDNYEVEAYLCPMKWTTTLDFLGMFDPEKLKKYDYVILYTGIVDWSPRKFSNAKNDLYDCGEQKNIANAGMNTINYSKKVVNNKKKIFDDVFGVSEMERHFSAPFETLYEGEETINMYRLEAARKSLIPLLASIPNLIFINANRICPDWNGDYIRERPKNMQIIHDYSRAFAEVFPCGRFIDLMEWTNDDVKIYTCDNLHLTEKGSDYIYAKILDVIETKNNSLALSNATLTSTVVSYCVQKIIDGIDDDFNHISLIRSLGTLLLLDPGATLKNIGANSKLRKCEELALKSKNMPNSLKKHYQEIRLRAKKCLSN